MSNKLVESVWDYSKNAEFYKYRPNYSDKAIDVFIEYVGAKKTKDFLTADIGAGTGNLTILLLNKGLNVDAVEPNDEMRKIGIEVTKNFNNRWVKANGIETTLESNKYNWVAFGSSFNVMDREQALKETHRLLKTDGYFSCMWNHRNLNCPIQTKAENIIMEFLPDYTRGVRREDQRPIIEKHNHLFKNIFYLEVDFEVNRTIDEYINAWRSVKNKYWDLSTEEGTELFNRITDKIRKELPETFKIQYTTRAWTAQKVR